MKKILMILAAGALCFTTACGGDDGGKNNSGSGPGPDPVPDGELHIPVTVKLQHQVTTNFGGAKATIDGAKILEFFGMTKEQFYTAMGKLTFTDAAAGQSSQSENTLEYGMYYDGQYNFTPATSNNFGHWFSKEGKISWWSNEEALGYFFTENTCEFATEAEEGPKYDDMWTYNVGIRDDRYDLSVGGKLSAVEVIYQSTTDKTVFIEWNIEIVDFIDPEAGKFNPANRRNETIDIKQTIPAEGVQAAVLDKLQDAFQLTKNELNKVIVAGGKIATENFIDNVLVEPSAGGFGGVWFNADGERTTWGETTGAAYFVELLSAPKELYVNVNFYSKDMQAAMVGKNFKNFKQVVTFTPDPENAPDTKFTCTITYDLTF